MNPTTMPNFNPEHLGALWAMYSVFIVMGVVVGLAISAYICHLLVKLYEAVPQGNRELEPGKVWFLMIPCVPLVYNFFVFPGLGRSIRAGLKAKGVEVDDSLEKMGLWYSICCACCVIPCVGSLTGIAALVLLILFLVKGYEMKKSLA